ncbi:MAG: hypothetical protein BVN29_06590 [Nitrospira sp. ST-bin5]|nr:MAG: hypothetical protein BVN29_06590 [Nitrospira sp. ST-bin5]
MAHLFTENGVPLLRGQNVLPGRIDLTDSKFISQQTHNLWKKSALRGGDIVIVRVGYPGTSAVVPKDFGAANAASLVVVRPNSSCVDSDFMCWVLLSDIGRRQVKAALVGGAQQVINIGTAASLLLPVPAKNEQRAIAGALSDVDALLGAQDRLIAKKRVLKQAAMQQLLTGQTRLPGFHGEWEVKRLGDLAKIQRGASPRPIDSPVWFDDNSLIGWVRISDVTRSGMFLIETTQRLSPLGVEHSRPVATGSLIMSICATVGRPIITHIDVCIHDGFVVFDNLQTDQRFLYYVLKWIEPDWSKHGQTGSQMNLNTGLINGTRISLPPLAEQTAIAEVLTEMDAELVGLEQRREKTRALKQAMMQELLTGRTRLVRPQEATT